MRFLERQVGLSPSQETCLPKLEYFAKELMLGGVI